MTDARRFLELAEPFHMMHGALPEVRKPQVYEANPHASAFDCGRAQAVLGWKARGTWEELCRTTRS